MNFRIGTRLIFRAAALFLPFAATASEPSILLDMNPVPENVKPFCFSDDGRTSDHVEARNVVENVIKQLAGSMKITCVKDGRIDFKCKDTSPTWWSLKGVRIKLEKPISWNDFEGIAFECGITGKMHSVWVALLDENGLWWDCLDTHLKPNAENKLEFEKQTFRRSILTAKYDQRPHPRTGKIVELAIYFRIFSSPDQDKTYSAFVKNIQFVSHFSDGRNEYEIDKKFPLQWKSANMREDGTMLVDGKPFFPLLLYSCMGTDPASATHKLSCYTGPTDDATLKARFKRIAEAGFNTLFSYTAEFYGMDVKPDWTDADIPKGKSKKDLRLEGSKRFLDFCRDAGLMGMTYIPFPDPIYYHPKNRRNVLNAQRETIRRKITALKDHPALLLWYMWDEPCEGKTPPNDLIQAYQYAKKLDPAHPFFIAASEPRNDVYYFRGADIFAPDGYPMNSNGPCTKDVDNIHTWFRPAMLDGKPFPWTILMIAHWDKPRWNRFPSIPYLRTLAFLSLADNQRGLAFYADRNYPERAPEFWKDLTLFIHSIRNLTPDILASEMVVTDKVKVGSDKIRWILHKVAGQKYYLLLAVNPQEEKAKPLSVGKVDFTFPEFRIDRIEAIDEDSAGVLSLGKTRNIPLNKAGNGFSDNFWEYATHAYRIYVK